jgi:2-hydroxy-6-oxonona-2,4-dienedioate hydrolase
VTPLVLVHGFMGGSAQWALQSPLAAQRPLICFDLPGYGQNAALDAFDSIEANAVWVLDQLDQRGIDQFFLLGHSMGGMIVQEITRRAPQRVQRLILYATGAMGLLPGRFETIEHSIDRAKAEGAARTAKRIAATWFLHREAAAEYPNCSEIAAQTRLTALICGLTAMKHWSGEAALPNISCPTLVLWGDGDRTYPWSQIETLWKTIPQARLAVLPHCAHAVHMEQPDLFNALIAGFIDTVEATPRAPQLL